MNIYVDIDETICFYEGERNYLLAIPNKKNYGVNKNCKEIFLICY